VDRQKLTLVEVQHLRVWRATIVPALHVGPGSWINGALRAIRIQTDCGYQSGLNMSCHRVPSGSPRFQPWTGLACRKDSTVLTIATSAPRLELFIERTELDRIKVVVSDKQFSPSWPASGRQPRRGSASRSQKRVPGSRASRHARILHARRRPL